MSKEIPESYWDHRIESRRSSLGLNLGEIFRYKDLLFLFVKRDLVTVYKQTILGPLWFFIQPVLTAITYTIIFGTMAKMDTGEIPKPVFYLAGVTIWTYFQDVLLKTSDTFVVNEGIFGKVYFPRIIVPLSIIFSHLFKFFLQFLLFLGFLLYYYFTTNSIHPNITVLLLPVYVIIMAMLGLGFGLIFTSLTNKYRDLKFLLQFGVQLLMFFSFIIYPLARVPEKYHSIIFLNPLVGIVEAFKYSFMGSNGGILSPYALLYSFGFALILLLFSISIFNKVERGFVDTV